MFTFQFGKYVVHFLESLGRDLIDNGWRYDLVVPLSSVSRENRLEHVAADSDETRDQRLDPTRRHAHRTDGPDGKTLS